MYLLFLDESGSPRLEGTKYVQNDFFVLGGIIVKEKEYFNCIKKYSEFKLSLPSSIQQLPLHAVDLNHVEKKDKRPNIYYGKISNEEGKDILKRCYDEFLPPLPVIYYAVIIDKYIHRAQYTSPQNPYSLAYNHILERFQSFVRTNEDEENKIGIVNLAQIDSSNSYLIQKTHEDLIENASTWPAQRGTFDFFSVKFSRIYTAAIVSTANKSPLFEIADLTCYAYYRAYYSKCTSLIPGLKPATNEFLPKLKDKIMQYKYDKSNLDGIKIHIFPKMRE